MFNQKRLGPKFTQKLPDDNLAEDWGSSNDHAIQLEHASTHSFIYSIFYLLIDCQPGTVLGAVYSVT